MHQVACEYSAPRAAAPSMGLVALSGDGGFDLDLAEMATIVKYNIPINHILPFGKTGGLQILRCRGIEVKNYDFNLRRLDSEALRFLQR